MTLSRFYDNLLQKHSKDPQQRDHANHLINLAKYCSNALELGVRDLNSCIYILRGLSESSSPVRSYVGIDLFLPPKETLLNVKRLANQAGISFQFIQANDIDVLATSHFDLLHIDSLHSYRHVTHQLETYAESIQKYILVHDTSSPTYAFKDFDLEYEFEIQKVNIANRSKYADWIDRDKKGLVPAIEDFLYRHPEWRIQKVSTFGTGLTILERI